MEVKSVVKSSQKPQTHMHRKQSMLQQNFHVVNMWGTRVRVISLQDTLDKISKGTSAMAVVGVKAAIFQGKTLETYDFLMLWHCDIERASQPIETQRVCADWKLWLPRLTIYICREIKLRDKQNAFFTKNAINRVQLSHCSDKYNSTRMHQTSRLLKSIQAFNCKQQWCTFDEQIKPTTAWSSLARSTSESGSKHTDTDMQLVAFRKKYQSEPKSARNSATALRLIVSMFLKISDIKYVGRWLTKATEKHARQDI